MAAAYDAIDKLPVLEPVNVPVAAMNVSADSSQPTKILASSPLSKTWPTSPEAEPDEPVANSTNLSAIVVFVDDTVVDTIIPAIREALRRGENLDHRHGHSGSAGWTSPPDWE